MYAFRYALLLACVLAPAGVCRADDAAANELLDKVIKAYGGADKVGKLQGVALKGTAMGKGGNEEIKMTFDVSLEGFDKIKLDAEIAVGGNNVRMVMVINGDKGWAHNFMENKTEEAPKEVLPPMRQFLTAIRSAGNPGALRGGELQIAHGGEGKFDETDAAILRIMRKDFSDITLYVDKKSNLPFKCETKIKEPNASEERLFEYRYSEFKDVGGVKHPHRIAIVMGEKESVDIEFREIKVDQKFDASTFDKP